MWDGFNVKRLFFAGGLGAALFVTAQSALADVCVEVDTQRDNLSESDRAATKTMLEQALESNGEHVVPSPCPTTWRVYHVKLGSSVTVVLSNGSDSRKLKVGKVEDVPEGYDQMIKSLKSGQPLSSENETVTRQNVTASQVSPNRIEADSLWYMRLGLGAVTNPGGVTTGPAIGLGYRYELDVIGIDLSLFNLAFTKENDDFSNISGSWVKLGAFYYFDPTANSTLYAGGGLGWAYTHVQYNDATYSNSGLDGEVSIGYELLRASTIRIFGQLDAVLPMYSAKATINSVDTSGNFISRKDSIYVPSFVLSIGLGFGRAHTVNIKHLD